jgi:hypothetical protein
MDSLVKLSYERLVAILADGDINHPLREVVTIELLEETIQKLKGN